MNGSFLRVLSVLPVLLLMAGGCSDDPAGVGKGLLTAQDTLHLETKVFNGTSTINFLTRINGNSGRILVGRSQDLEANSLIEFTGIPAFAAGVTVDSARITFAIDYRFKDSTGEFGLEAHRMIRTWATSSFKWDSIPGSHDNTLAGSYVQTMAPSDTSISVPIDTAVIRLWSQAGGTGSLFLAPSLTARMVLGFTNSLTLTSDTRPLLRFSYHDSTGIEKPDSMRSSRAIFVANSTFPALPQHTIVQAGVDYPALLRFDSLTIPPRVSVIQASLEFAVDEGASLLNGYTRDSLIVYMTRRDAYPYDSLAFGTVCSPELIGIQKFYRADVKNIVQQWLTRQPNLGFALHPYAEFTSLDRFALFGADAPANLRPRLTVSYTLFP